MLYSEILTVSSHATLAKEFLEDTEKCIKQVLELDGMTTIYYPDGFGKPLVADIYNLVTDNNTSVADQLKNDLAMVQRALAITRQVDEDIDVIWRDM